MFSAPEGAHKPHF